MKSWVLVLLGVAGCARSSIGFVLPDGDAARGRAAFERLGCSSCHVVAGVNGLSEPTIRPPAPMLGGKVNFVPTDGQLVTSIVNPDHDIRPHFTIKTRADGGHSRMNEYSERMTVAELIDVVAFLRPTFDTSIVPKR